MFRSYDHHRGLLLCLCNILFNGVHASLYFGVWQYVIWALYVWCVPFGVRLCKVKYSNPTRGLVAFGVLVD
jgi:hypothetical protein